MGARWGKTLQTSTSHRTAGADLDDRRTDGRTEAAEDCGGSPPTTSTESQAGGRAGDDSACVEWTQDGGFPAWASGDSLTNLQRANGSASPVSF